MINTLRKKDRKTRGGNGKVGKVGRDSNEKERCRMKVGQFQNCGYAWHWRLALVKAKINGARPMRVEISIQLVESASEASTSVLFFIADADSLFCCCWMG